MRIGDATISTELYSGPVVTLSGQTFDFGSGEGIIHALSALVVASGGEVTNANSSDEDAGGEK